MGVASGFGPLGVSNAAQSASAGPPFPAGSANNGLSVDAVSGKIVLGDNTGGVLSTLLSNREIPTAGFFTALSGLGNLIVGKNTDNGARFQIDLSNTAAQAVTAANITATWNTSGTPTLLAGTVTNTASGANSLLADIRATGQGRLRLFSNGGLTLSGPVNANYVVITATNLAAGSSSGGAGQTTQLNLLPRYFNNAGAATLQALAIQAQISMSGGTGDTIDVALVSNINQSGAYVGNARGVYYNPFIGSLLAGNRNIAWENTTGDANFNTTSGNVTMGATGALTLKTANTTHSITIGDVSNTGAGTSIFVDDAGSQGVIVNASGGIQLTDPGVPLNTSSFNPSSLTLKNNNGANTAVLSATATNTFLVNAANGMAITDVSAASSTLPKLTLGVLSGNNGRIFFDTAANVFLIQNNSNGGITMGTTVEFDAFFMNNQGAITLSGGGPGNKYFIGVGTTSNVSVSIGNLSGLGNGTKFVITDVANTAVLTCSSGLTITGSGVLLRSGTALTNGAAAAGGTLLNAPVAGNPTKWIPIVDNGTTRFIPCW